MLLSFDGFIDRSPYRRAVSRTFYCSDVTIKDEIKYSLEFEPSTERLDLLPFFYVVFQTRIPPCCHRKCRIRPLLKRLVDLLSLITPFSVPSAIRALSIIVSHVFVAGACSIPYLVTLHVH